jgi:hypothetical protein
MAGREMNALEVAAGKIVALYLSGRETATDVPGAGDMTVDFDVLLPDGPTVGLEVTSSADEKVLSLLAAGSRQWSASGLADDWQVGVAHDKGVFVTHVMRQMPGLLEIYEREGVTEVDTWNDPRWSRSLSGLSSDPAEAAQRQFGLDVVIARSFGPKQGSVAQIYMTAHGGAISHVDQVNALVEAAAESNRQKLAAVAADERHLFVWLNPSRADAELAVATLPPPSAPPAIPPEVHVVWLSTHGARGFGDVQLERLWRVRPPNGWEQLDPSIYGR